MTKPLLAPLVGALVVVFTACGPTVVTVHGQLDDGVAPPDDEPADDGMSLVDNGVGEEGPGYEGEEEPPPVDDEDVPYDDAGGDTDVQAFSTGARCASNAHTGDYCGGDKVNNGNRNTLYRCHGPGPATVVRSCANGCHVAAAGHDDYCSAPPPPRCDANAHVGYYCGGDKVTHANANVLYQCNGPGPAAVAQRCDASCIVAAPGHDDRCESTDTCAHHSQLRWGLAPRQSDHLRCAGISASGISQTIGNAAASAGTHAQDGTAGGFAYCAATDLRTAGMSNAQVRALLTRLADQGFAAFFRNPGHDGWPSSEIRHIHAIYVGVHMKASLRAQVQDWLNGRNGLVSHSTYTFWQANHSRKNAIRTLFNQHN